MAILKQTTNGASFYLGWYGTCEETDCTQEFDLASEPAIIAVYKAIGTGFESYSSSGASFLNNFSKLKCGEAYYIVISKGTENKDIDIPDLTIVESNPNSEELKPLIAMCSVNGDGTVVDNEIVKSKNMKLPVILIAWQTGDTNTEYHFSSSELVFEETMRYANKGDVESLLNQKNYKYPNSQIQETTGSVSDYYNSISFGQLNLEYEIIPAGTNPDPNTNNLNDYAYISNESMNNVSGQRAKKVSQLVKLAFDKAVENFKHTGNNFFEKYWEGVPITVIHAGFGAEGGNYYRHKDGEIIDDTTKSSRQPGRFIWSHKSQFSYIKEDGTSLNVKYNINPFLLKQDNFYLEKLPYITPIGVLAHESGHVWSLKDFYDIRNYGGSGIGRIALMGSGQIGNSSQTRKYSPSFAISFTRWHMSKKQKLFDTELIEINENVFNLEIKPTTDENKLYKVLHPSGNDAWWIEYRSSESAGNVNKINFDKYIAESGLVIVHQANLLNSNENYKNIKLRIPEHRRGESGYPLSLEQRDGVFALSGGGGIMSKNITNDFYHPGDEFSPYTVPSSIGQDGVPSGIKIHNIRKTNSNSLLVDIEFLQEPNSKIISVDYNWADDIYDMNDSRRSQYVNSNVGENLSVTIKTENVSDGAKINMVVYPGGSNDIDFTGIVTNNECVINFTKSELRLSGFSFGGSGRLKGRANHIKYFIDTGDSQSDTFPWVDYVLGLNSI